MVMMLLSFLILHVGAQNVGETQPFGHPCYKGDKVKTNRDLQYPGLDFKIDKGKSIGIIADNLGAHGEAPLNVQWQQDEQSPRRVFQITYEDLSDDSCMTPDAGVVCGEDKEGKLGGKCIGQPPGTEIGG